MANKRLFFALWPDPVLKASIAHAARTPARPLGGRRVRDESLHLTLLFLGDVEADAQARLEAAAREVRVPAFDLALDRVGSFFRARVLWVGPAEVPAQLPALRAALERAAHAAGVAFDPKPLVPHVTCYRDVRKALDPAPVAALRWPVRGFALVESRGGQYHVVSQWPLHNVPR